MFFLGSVLGMFLGKQYYPQPVPTPAPSPIASSTSFSDLTANWKLYTDSEVGYSVKYPNHINEAAPNCGSAGELPKKENGTTQFLPGPPCGPLFSIGTLDNPNRLDPYDFWKKSVGAKAECTAYGRRPYYICSENIALDSETLPLIYEVYKTFISNGRTEAFMVEVKEGPGIYFDTMYIPISDDKVLIATSDDWPTANQILSTFAFLERSSDTSTWKEFMDPTFGVELKYPPEFSISRDGNGSTQDIVTFSSEEKSFSLSRLKTEADQIPYGGTTEYSMVFNGNIWTFTSSGEIPYCDAGGCSYPVPNFHINRNGYEYSLQYYSSDLEKLVEEILATLKFL